MAPRGLRLHVIALSACMLTVLHASSADTLFGADLTIMEEGTELLHRLKAHLEQVG
jgi:hypothetical protein